MNEVTRYTPQRYDLEKELTRPPKGDPVEMYLNRLRRRSTTSATTMEQALGVVVSLLKGDGRPDNGAQQPRAQRKATAAQMKRAAHDFDWFAFDGEQARTLIDALVAEQYAASSQGKMIAAVVGTLKQVQVVNTQGLIDAHARLVAEPMTPDDKLKANQIIDMYFGHRALITQSAMIVIDDFTPAEPKQRQGRKVEEQPQPEPQRKRRKGTIDRSTKGTSEHRQLTKREMNALWGVCAKGGNKGARDMCIIALGFGCGLRRSEIAALQYADIDWNGKTIEQESNEDGEVSRDLQIDGAEGKGEDYLPITIRHGKGDKKRIVNASNGTRQALLQWVKVRGTAPGPLLFSIDRWEGVQEGKGIDPQVIYSVCDELATRAKVKKFSPHDMRRTFISGFLAASKDLAMAKQLAGHSNVQTTTIYDVRGEDAKARASVEHVHVPFEQVTVQEKLDDEQGKL